MWIRKFTFEMCVSSHPSHRPSKVMTSSCCETGTWWSWDILTHLMMSCGELGAGQELVGSDGILYLKLADGRLESSGNHSLGRCHQFAVGTWHFRELMVSMKCIPRRNWHR